MRKKRKLSECLSGEVQVVLPTTGTGRNMLLDLLSSTVLVKRVMLTNCQTDSHPLQGHGKQNQDKHLPSTSLTQEEENGACSICGSCNGNCQPFTQKEMEILVEFILKPFLVSIVAAENLATMFHWLCHGCFRTLEKLTKLKAEINKITTCLRAVIRIQLKKKDASVIAVPEKLPETEPEEPRSSSLLKDDDNYENDNSLQSRPNSINGELHEEPIRTLPNLPLIEQNQVIPHAEERPEEETAVPLVGPEDQLNATENTDIDADSWSRISDICPSPSESNPNSTNNGEIIRSQKNAHKRNRNRNKRTRVELVDPLASSPEKFDVQQKTISNKKGMIHNNKLKRGTERVKCHLCMLDYSCESSLGRHLRSKLHEEGTKTRKINANGAITFACDMCQQEFNFLTELAPHKRANHKNATGSHSKSKQLQLEQGVSVQENINVDHVDVKHFHNNSTTSVDHDHEHVEIKPVILNMEFDIMDDPPESPAPAEQELEDQVRTKRKSRARAEEALHAMSKNNTADDANEEEDEGSDAHIDDEEEDESEDSSYDGELEREDDLNEQSKFCCEPCNKEFTRQRNLDRHLLTDSHAIQVGGEEALAELEEQKQKQKRFQCLTCEKKFMQASYLRKHERLRHQTIRLTATQLGESQQNKCDICLLNFMKSDDDYTNHTSSMAHALGEKTRIRDKDGSVIFACDQCDESFNLVLKLGQHIQELHGKRGGERDKICWPCNKKFTRARNLAHHLLKESHIKQVGGDDALAELQMQKIAVDPLECIACGEKSPDLKALRLHQSQHPNDKCDICDTKFSDTHYNTHMSSDSHKMAIKTMQRDNNGAITFSCQECDNQSFSTIRDLATHTTNVHGAAAIKERELYKDVPLACGPCDKIFQRIEGLKIHLRSMGHAARIGDVEALEKLEKRETFQCDLCERRYYKLRSLKEHKRDHHGKGPVICHICGTQLMNFAKSLEGHIAAMHPDIPKPPAVRKKPNLFIPPQKKDYPCKICDKRFTQKPHMLRHIKVIHEGHLHECDLCQKEFRSANSLRRHKVLVHGATSTMELKNKAAKQRYSCEICSSTLVGRYNLTRHIELKHFPAKDSCPYGCPDKIETEEEWLAHLEQCKSDKITEESKFLCIYCGDIFSNIFLKIAHHLRLHKSYPCEFCSKLFTRKEVLSQHVHEHEESKPWLCTKCGKRFRQPWNLQLHSTTVCGDDDAAKEALIAKRRELHKIYREKGKPHKCNQCGKAFVEERRLQDHKNKVHLNEIEDPPPTADESGEKETGGEVGEVYGLIEKMNYYS